MLTKFFKIVSVSINDDLTKISQINEAYGFLQEFIISDHFELMPIQLKNQINKLITELATIITKLNDGHEKKINTNIQNCREKIDGIFKKILSSCYKAEEVIALAQQINKIFFSEQDNTNEQKAKATLHLLTARNRENYEEKKIEITNTIEEKNNLVLNLASSFLSTNEISFINDSIPEKMIEYLAKNNGGNDNKIHLSLWISYKKELDNKLTENYCQEKLLNCLENILDYLMNPIRINGEANTDSLSVNMNEIKSWFDQIFYGVKEHNTQINICAIAWKKLLINDEEKALRILKFIMNSLTHIEIMRKNKFINNPVKNDESLALFLLKIPKLSENNELKIKAIIIKTMGYKIYDLIAAHFELENKLEIRLIERKNCIIYAIIDSLVSNNSLKEIITSSIKPITDLIANRKVTGIKGCHLLLTSANEVPIANNLDRFALKIMSSQPTPSHFSHNLYGSQIRKNLFVLHQPVSSEPPVAIYFVDRRGLRPFIMELEFIPNENTTTLTEALFPLVKDFVYSDKEAPHANDIDIISDKTNFFIYDIPALIKIEDKNEFFIHSLLANETAAVSRFGVNDEKILNYLDDLNVNNYFNSEKIWVSSEHHAPLYEAILSMDGGEKIMKKYSCIGLKDAFAKSIKQLFNFQNYTPELLRILHDYFQINKNEFLGLNPYLNPTIKFQNHNTEKLKFWCEELVSYAIQLLTADEGKKNPYPMRISKPVLDFIYSQDLRNEVASSCGFLMDFNVLELNFNMMFKNPFLQLAKDAGLSAKIKGFPQAFEDQYKHFPKMLTQLKMLLNEGKIAQKNKEESLNQLESYEYDFLILCYCFQEEFKEAVTIEVLTSSMDKKIREGVQAQYIDILHSTLTKLKQINASEALNHLKTIKNRTEYCQFNALPEKTQLKILIQKTCKKIWDKKVYEQYEDPHTLAPSLVADKHFERLEKLSNEFESFCEYQRGHFFEINLNEQKKQLSQSFVIPENSFYSHTALLSFIQQNSGANKNTTTVSPTSMNTYTKIDG